MKKFLMVLGAILLPTIFGQLYTKRHPDVPSYTPPTKVPRVSVK